MRKLGAILTSDYERSFSPLQTAAGHFIPHYSLAAKAAMKIGEKVNGGFYLDGYMEFDYNYYTFTGSKVTGLLVGRIAPSFSFPLSEIADIIPSQTYIRTQAFAIVTRRGDYYYYFVFNPFVSGGPQFVRELQNKVYN